MKRLTRAGNSKYVSCNIDDECTGMCGSCKRNSEIRRKLKEYEDLEEQGLTLKLPCNIGDVVYYFKILNDGKDTIVIKEFKIHMFSFTDSGLFIIDHFRHSICTDLLNETVFLTKAEAEKALAEMEGEVND